DLLELPHRRVDVAVTLVDKALRESVAGPLNVAKVHVEYPAPRPEPLDGVQHSFAAAHFRPASVTEIQAVHGAGMHLHRAAEVVEVPKDTRYTPQRRHGGIVGMNGESDPGLLADREDPGEIPVVILPHLLVGVL